MASSSEDEKRREYFQNVLSALKTQSLTSLGMQYIYFVLHIQEFDSSEQFRCTWSAWK